MIYRVIKSKSYNEAKWKKIHDLIWQWVINSIVFDLNNNRALLQIELNSAEQLYMKKNWLPKKSLIIICFVTLHLNLEIVTTQRNESMHSVIKTILNTQISLKTAFNNIRAELKRLHRLIRKKKKKSRIRRSRDVDFMIFQLFIDRVTIWIMKKINSKWMAIVIVAKQIRDDQKKIVQNSCKCEIVVQYDLLCKHFHHLLRAAIESFFIFITLLHSRWRLNDSESDTNDWQSHYYDADSNQFDFDINHDHNRNRFVSSAIEQQILYERFSKKDRDALIDQITAFTKNVINTHDALTKIKTEIHVKLFKSSSTKKKLWLLKKHDKADRRAATAAEAAEKMIKQYDKVNKIFSSSASSTMISTFRSAFRIVISAFSSSIFSSLSIISEFSSSVFDSSSSNFDSSNSSSSSSFSFFVFSTSSKRKDDRSKDSKNASKSQKLLSSTNSSSSSSRFHGFTSSSIITKSKREMKKKKIWEQASQKKFKRKQRNATLNAAAVKSDIAYDEHNREWMSFCIKNAIQR